MKISIAMASYNGEAYLTEQLESFVVQSRQPDELIVTDDGSTDDTVKLLEAFALKAPFKVKVYQNDSRLGYAHNFEKALGLCSGDLVFLSDQDDVWFPSKIQHIADLAQKYPNKSLFMNDARLADADLNESEFSKIGQIRDLGLPDRNFVMGCCIGIRRDLLTGILPIPDGYTGGHDDWLVTMADQLELRMIDGSILQYYRIHDSNTSMFIANNLFKMKRKTPPKKSFIHASTDWIKRSKTAILAKSIKEREISLKVLEKVSKLENYRSLAEVKIYKMEKEIDLYRQRLSILQTESILTRAVRASKFYSRGSYSTFNGAKTCLSDILHR